MSKRPWFPFYTADFLRKTDHLSAEECGCYIRLMRHYWDNNGMLQNNPAQLCRIMGVERRRFKSIWLQLDTFFERRNGDLSGTLLLPRLQAELNKTIAISEAKAVSGHKGGLASAVAKKKHMPTHSHSHYIKKEEQRGPDARSRASRLSKDWQPSKAEIDYCRTKRPDLNPEVVAENFRDYWISKPGTAGTKLDWSATWRGWVRNEKQQRANVAPLADIISPTHDRIDFNKLRAAEKALDPVDP